MVTPEPASDQPWRRSSQCCVWSPATRTLRDRYERKRRRTGFGCKLSARDVGWNSRTRGHAGQPPSTRTVVGEGRFQDSVALGNGVEVLESKFLTFAAGYWSIVTADCPTVSSE